MKTQYLTYLALFSFIICFGIFPSCKSLNHAMTYNYKNLPKDSVINVLIGDSIFNIINNPTSIRAYKMCSGKLGKNKRIGNYSIDYYIGRLDMTYASPLIFYINDITNYDESNDVIKTPFTPTIAFEFKRRSKSVYLLISFNGNQLMFLDKNNEIIRKQFLNSRFLLRLSHGLLPNNKYIEYMLNQ